MNNAFASFVNYMKTALTGSGIGLFVEKSDKPTPPYIVLQEGPDNLKRAWMSSQLCQAWVVVGRKDTEPLEVTAGKTLRTVYEAIQSAGSIHKYDYLQDPPEIKGTVLITLSGVSKDMSQDENISKKVITLELHSNASV